MFPNLAGRARQRSTTARARHRDVEEAHRRPSARDREADVRLVLRVSVPDDVEVEDRDQHDDVGEQAETRDEGMGEEPELRRPSEGDHRTQAREAIERECAEVRRQRDSRQTDDRLDADCADHGGERDQHPDDPMRRGEPPVQCAEYLGHLAVLSHRVAHSDSRVETAERRPEQRDDDGHRNRDHQAEADLAEHHEWRERSRIEQPRAPRTQLEDAIDVTAVGDHECAKARRAMGRA